MCLVSTLNFHLVSETIDFQVLSSLTPYFKYIPTLQPIGEIPYTIDPGKVSMTLFLFLIGVS